MYPRNPTLYRTLTGENCLCWFVIRDDTKYSRQSNTAYSMQTNILKGNELSLRSYSLLH